MKTLTTVLAQTTPAPTTQAAWSAFIAAATCLAPRNKGALHPRALPQDCPKSWKEIRAAVEAAFDQEWDYPDTQAIEVVEDSVSINCWPHSQSLPVLVLRYGAGRSYVQAAFLDNNQGAWVTTGVSQHHDLPMGIQEVEEVLHSWKRRQRAVARHCPEGNEPAWLATLRSEAQQRFEEATQIEVVRRNPQPADFDDIEEEEDA